MLNCTLQTTNLKQFPTSPLYRITLSKFRHFKSVVYSLHNINSWIKWKGNGAQIHYQEKPCMSSPYVRFPSLTNLISSIEILDFERKSYTWWSSTHLTRTAELEHHTNKSPMTLCGLNFFGCVCFHEMFAWNVTNNMKYEHTPKVRFIATDHKYLTSKTFVKNYLTKKTV